MYAIRSYYGQAEQAIRRYKTGSIKSGHGIPFLNVSLRKERFYPVYHRVFLWYSKNMLVSLKNRIIQLKDADSGGLTQIALGLECDGTLVITDADHDIPQFTERVRLNGFPTDEAIAAAVSNALGGTREFVKALDSTIDLDASVLAGLGKMPVDIFDNVYLAEVKDDALILCVDMRNFSDFLCANPEETVFDLIKEFRNNFV